MVLKEARDWHEVVQAIRAGNRERFREIILHFQDELRFVVAYHIRGDAERVDEVVHCAFVRAFRSLGRFDLGRSMGAWLKVIAQREAVDEVRRVCRSSRRAGERVQAELMRAREDQNPSPEALVTLRQCITHLAGTARELVRMRYFERMGFDAIARVLGRSAGSLRVAMLQVRRSLKTCVEKAEA